MTAVALVLAVAMLIAAFLDWRRGLYLCIVAGFLQDPLRKVLPGQPVAVVVFVAAVFVASLVGAFARGERLDGSQLVRWYPRLQGPMTAFVIVVLLQTVATVLRYRNLTLAGIGLLSYLSPIAAIVAFFQFNRGWGDAYRWMRFYIAATALMSATIFLQFLGYSPQIFVSIGLDTVYGIGGRIAMLCGIMRSSEVAAFHAGAAACLALTLAAIARSTRAQILYSALVPVFLLAIVLGGRRKMLAQFVIYLVTFLFLLMRSRRSQSRATSLISTIVLVVVLVGTTLFFTDNEQSALTPYLTRSASVFGEAGERLESMTVGSMGTVLSITGFLGRGAGTTGQGSQYFGGSEAIVAAPAEGGLGRVLAELGLPGLVCLLWLGWAVLAAVQSVAGEARSASTTHAVLVYGLLSFLPSHAMVFLTAHQVYGDPFVLLVLGALVGFGMSARRVAALAAQRTQAAAGQQPQTLASGRSAVGPSLPHPPFLPRGRTR